MRKQVVLVVEDDPTWQEILSELLDDIGYAAEVVASAGEALTALKERVFALAVVDISLSFADHGHRGGVEVLKAIEKIVLRLPAIVVTGYPSVDLAVETLAELSAVHFFPKHEFQRRKFKEVVRQVALATNPINLLSEREQQVLMLMGQGQTNQEIADTLYVSINTVKKHAQNIFTKLQVDSRAAAVAVALKGSD